MELHEYTRYDAIGLRDLLRAREVSAVEVEAVARDALASADADLNGLALPLFEPALDHAFDGPLAGVPFLIKDSGPMAEGVPFALGSRSLEGLVARSDNDLMTRFRAGGLVTLGLTTVPEMAISFATGVAAEFALTRTVRDAAHVLDAIHGPGVGDKYSAPPPRGLYADELEVGPGTLRVGVTTEAWSGVAVDAEVAAAAEHTGRLLEDLGHIVTDASPAVDWEAVMQSSAGEMVAIAAPFLAAPRPPEPAELEAVSRTILAEAQELSALDLVAVFDAQNRVSRSVGAFFTEYDLLVTPTMGRLPAPHGTLEQDNPDHTTRTWLESLFAYGPFTVVFNISGQPAISLPLAQSASGLPIGVQLVAPYGREDLLFQVAASLL